MTQPKYCKGSAGVNRKIAWEGCKKPMLGALLGGAVIEGHEQMQGNAKTVLGEVLDAHHFGHVFTVHGIVRGGEGKGDKDAHTLVVVFAAGLEVDAVLRGINTGRIVLKVFVARLGGANAQGLGDFGAPVKPLFGVPGLGLVVHMRAPGGEA